MAILRIIEPDPCILERQQPLFLSFITFAWFSISTHPRRSSASTVMAFDLASRGEDASATGQSSLNI